MESVLVEKKKKWTLGEVLPWSYPLAGFAVVAVMLVVYLCQFAQIVSAQYSLVEIRGETKVLQREKAELKLAIQELTSLERVENVALKQLGMVTPENREMLRIQPLAAQIPGHQVAVSQALERF